MQTLMVREVEAMLIRFSAAATLHNVISPVMRQPIAAHGSGLHIHWEAEVLVI